MHFLNETELQNIIAHDGRQDIFVFNDYYIRSSECDMYDLVHTDVLFSLLQEAADIGAEKAGISYKIMDRLQCAWVLSRVSLRLQRSPGVKERVRIYTWQSGMDRVNFFRDFYLFDADGEALGAARSSWNVVSINEHKLLATIPLTGLRISSWPMSEPIRSKMPATRSSQTIRRFLAVKLNC